MREVAAVRRVQRGGRTARGRAGRLLLAAHAGEEVERASLMVVWGALLGMVCAGCRGGDRAQSVGNGERTGMWAL